MAIRFGRRFTPPHTEAQLVQVESGEGTVTKDSPLELRVITCGAGFTDLGPFRAIRREALEQLDLRDTRFGWNVEMQMKALHANLRIVEVPVRYRPRLGRSKISGTLTGTLRAGIGILSTIFAYW
ncbi:MAG: hypothetical protein HYZ92_06020 [Candidatus Omnitrophica bacterium]|nr:hypothetical protein [Candidatus Omnitrophota bacterium]